MQPAELTIEQAQKKLAKKEVSASPTLAASKLALTFIPSFSHTRLDQFENPLSDKQRILRITCLLPVARY